MIFLLLCLTDFSMTPSRSIHVAANRIRELCLRAKAPRFKLWFLCLLTMWLCENHIAFVSFHFPISEKALALHLFLFCMVALSFQNSVLCFSFYVYIYVHTHTHTLFLFIYLAVLGLSCRIWVGSLICVVACGIFSWIFSWDFQTL